MPAILAAIYVTGCLGVVIRFSFGVVRLVRWSRRGEVMKAAQQTNVESAAREIGLRQIPRVKISRDVNMPLVFGVLRPVMLLPSDFETWSGDEQRATLLHELMHINRRDMLGQVVQCGMEAERYAASLLIIVARVKPRFSTSLSPSPAIAMSAQSGLEDRLRQILYAAPPRTLVMVLAGPCSILAMLLVIAITTVRVKIVAAQDPPIVPAVTIPNASETKVESDLVARFTDCEVLTVNGDEFAGINTVSGQVVSPAGDPVAGATVLLRESSSRRMNIESEKYRYAENRNELRTEDVFARTTTDIDGKKRNHFYGFDSWRSHASSDG